MGMRAASRPPPPSGRPAPATQLLSPTPVLPGLASSQPARQAGLVGMRAASRPPPPSGRPAPATQLLSPTPVLPGLASSQPARQAGLVGMRAASRPPPPSSHPAPQPHPSTAWSGFQPASQAGWSSGGGGGGSRQQATTSSQQAGMSSQQATTSSQQAPAGSRPAIGKRRRPSQFTNFEERMIGILESPTPQPATTAAVEDQDELFFLSLLPDLKRLTEAKKAYVKLKIHQLREDW